MWYTIPRRFKPQTDFYMEQLRVEIAAQKTLNPQKCKTISLNSLSMLHKDIYVSGTAIKLLIKRAGGGGGVERK